MKKVTCLFFASLIALTFSSCKKEDVTVTKTINVELKANESYSSEVPAGDADDVMQITSQAQHASTSNLSADPTTGGMVFHYTPALDYSGTDQVQITNSEGEHHGGGQSHGGMCSGHHHDDNTVYVYKITIKGDTNVGMKVNRFRTVGCPSF